MSRPKEVADLLRWRQFSLVIVTNFGTSPWQAVGAVSEHRDHPVLFLTGHVDDVIESACRTKNIPVRRVPIDVPDLCKELRIALDVP